MRHLVDGKNIALITSRLTKGESFAHVQVTDAITEVICISPKTSNNGFIFPLFIYPFATDPKPRKGDLFAVADPFAGKERVENIAPAFRAWLDDRLGRHHSPEDVLGYIYAVLHAPTYRASYAEFLRSDFPRIPFPQEDAAFVALAALGISLIEAHLLRAIPKCGLGGFTGKGDERVETIRYSALDRHIHINATQGFANVPSEVWDFTIGGYQVLDKYLKSRRGRILTLDEIENVEAIANVLAFTIERTTDIETAYRAAFPDTACEDAAD